MRLTLLALPLAFLSLVAAHGAHNHARDLDELSTRDILEDISTRELLAELSSRLERRGGNRRGGKATGWAPILPFRCAYCLIDITTSKGRNHPPIPQQGARPHLLMRTAGPFRNAGNRKRARGNEINGCGTSECVEAGSGKGKESERWTMRLTENHTRVFKLPILFIHSRRSTLTLPAEVAKGYTSTSTLVSYLRSGEWEERTRSKRYNFICTPTADPIEDNTISGRQRTDQVPKPTTNTVPTPDRRTLEDPHTRHREPRYELNPLYILTYIAPSRSTSHHRTQNIEGSTHNSSNRTTSRRKERRTSRRKERGKEKTNTLKTDNTIITTTTQQSTVHIQVHTHFHPIAASTTLPILQPTSTLTPHNLAPRDRLPLNLSHLKVLLRPPHRGLQRNFGVQVLGSLHGGSRKDIPPQSSLISGVRSGRREHDQEDITSYKYSNHGPNRGYHRTETDQQNRTTNTLPTPYRSRTVPNSRKRSTLKHPLTPQSTRLYVRTRYGEPEKIEIEIQHNHLHFIYTAFRRNIVET
ncbi:hypothetical protein DFP72DRAFT_856650 [Ephemerocybe angulata]|uniref:Uncharacterized protein n=1 Tax=Ephemerocybe angulata TaxID=980116 RepID=A0A8H6LX17_9AGAR|nr:hypothetical protein DFP72DRAFT_856650 [Tulosesus angulatus]